MTLNTHQRNIFLASEADAWFERNQLGVQKKDFCHDTVVREVMEIAKLPQYSNVKLKVLEIGCGEGRRLEWLSKNFDVEVFGIEPSAKAVEQARIRGVNAQRGTADNLQFAHSFFDVVIFGFCLYLCDRQDLFQIASEANRVLKPDAWIIIHDFFAPLPIKREYHHKLGIYSYKMDYRTLFDWHSAYTCYSHQLNHHEIHGFTDDPNEWVATSVIRKNIKSDE